MTSANRSAAVLVAVVLLAAFCASVTRADALTGDPRKCSSGETPTKPVDCAKGAAKITLLTYMRAHRGKNFSNPISCAQSNPPSLLKWRCSFVTGTANVWFRATSTGWKRIVTVNT